MTKKSFLDCERKNLEKMKNLQLPNSFKKIGYSLFIISFVLLVISNFIIENLNYIVIAKYGLLIGMLLYSISKEKIEDELIIKLRMQSYSFAFILGVIYNLIVPIISLLLNSKNHLIKEMGDFQILWVLLSFQLFYFEIQKKLYK